MSCDGVRIGEYFDGELAGSERAAVDSHLAACAECRRDIEELRRLEGLLARVPAGIPQDADGLARRVRERARVSRSPWLAVAAGMLVGIAIYAVASGRPVDVRADLEAYAKRPTIAIEAQIRSAGPAGLAVLEAALSDPDVRIQFAAATLLFRSGDGGVRERVLARFQSRGPANGWTLSEIGADEDDAEITPVAISLALAGQEERAYHLLRRLNRMASQDRVIDAVVTLLKTPSEKVQRLALDIVKELDIEFPLPAMVDLLDSPELGEKAADLLRKATGEDHGRDKAAWRKALGRKEKRL